MTITLLAQIAPQRSTQYATLAATLAPHELQLSPLGPQILYMEPRRLGGNAYLALELSDGERIVPSETLATLAMTSAFFDYREQLAELPGPWLRPIETNFTPALPPELVEARRYRGKTNARFTHFLLNLAKFSSRLAAEPWRNLRVFDPLAGGGTTLFMALVLGAEAAGVEQNSKDIHTTATFLKQFLQEARISHKVQSARLKKLGQRWHFTIGKRKVDITPQRCILAQGETHDAVALVDGFKPHLIVADLPYGIQHYDIQHQGQLSMLLQSALPVWAAMLPRGGAMALAWDATRVARAEMIALVAEASGLTILNETPYDQLAHRVDRVIKRRDVLVARA